MVELFAHSGDPDQMPRYAVSDLGLHCLPVIHLGVFNGLMEKFCICFQKKERSSRKIFFLWNLKPFSKEMTWKEFAPISPAPSLIGSKFSPLKIQPFLGREANTFWSEFSPLKVYLFTLRGMDTQSGEATPCQNYFASLLKRGLF